MCQKNHRNCKYELKGKNQHHHQIYFSTKFMYWFILYAMHRNTMIYDDYHLSPELDSVKCKHKTTHCSSSAPGEVCGLLQLISALHEQYVVQKMS